MNNIERYVVEALQKMVTNAVAGTGSPPVKYLGRNMNPPTDGKWWEVVYIPNNITNQFWDEGKTYRGALRLVLHWPQDDRGVYGPLDEVARVSDKIVKGAIYTDIGSNAFIRIIEHPDTSGVIEQPPENIMSLTIRYSCFKI
jgi:hypothetical protein